MSDVRSCKACGAPCPTAVDTYCGRACWAADNPKADEEPEFDVDWNDDSY